MTPPTKDPDDRELHQRLLGGDSLAGSRLYERHLPRVIRICRAVLGDDHLAEDVAQDVLVELLIKPDRADLARSPLTAYLAMTARRRAIDVIRSRERSRRREAVVAETAAALIAPADDVSIDEVPVKLDLRRALSKLPRAQRVVVDRAYYGERTYGEAAVELGIAEGTAKSRMRSALTRLRSEPALADAVQG